jgi:hypothetical protein
VWHVTRRTDDPFIALPETPLYRTTNADPDHAPLLYGPYVLYRDLLEGVWVRVQYEQQAAQAKQLIKVPFHAGWSIVAIKNANWRYWTLVLRNPQTKAHEDFFLVSPIGGGAATTPPFMLAPLCAQCGVKATHMCGSCLSVGFCIDHGQENTHGGTCAAK